MQGIAGTVAVSAVPSAEGAGEQGRRKAATAEVCCAGSSGGGAGGEKVFGWAAAMLPACRICNFSIEARSSTNFEACF